MISHWEDLEKLEGDQFLVVAVGVFVEESSSHLRSFLRVIMQWCTCLAREKDEMASKLLNTPTKQILPSTASKTLSHICLPDFTFR